MPIEAPNKFISPGYPVTCPCGEPTPCNAEMQPDGYPTVTCPACGYRWTYYEMTGWSADSQSEVMHARRTGTTELKPRGTTELKPRGTTADLIYLHFRKK